MEIHAFNPAGVIRPHGFGGVYFCGREPSSFERLERIFRECPAAPMPAGFRHWWKATEPYRREWQDELQRGVYDDAPYAPHTSHFYLSNRDPSDLEDGADVVAPIYMVLATRDEKGEIRFSESVVSGLACYGEMIAPSRHSFREIVSTGLN